MSIKAEYMVEICYNRPDMPSLQFFSQKYENKQTFLHIVTPLIITVFALDEKQV